MVCTASWKNGKSRARRSHETRCQKIGCQNQSCRKFDIENFTTRSLTIKLVEDAQEALKKDELGYLILKCLARFGPLNHTQLSQLVECENTEYQFGSNKGVAHKVRKTVNHLIDQYGYIFYDSRTGNLAITESIREFCSTTFKTSSIIGVEEVGELSNHKVRYVETGIGTDYVYVFYPKTMRIEAIVKGWDVWPLKIGRTNNLHRRLKQLSESGPNLLSVGLSIRTSIAQELEKHIHQVLTKRGQDIALAGRREWFRSNIQQIEDIHRDFQNKVLI